MLYLVLKIFLNLKMMIKNHIVDILYPNKELYSHFGGSLWIAQH